MNRDETDLAHLLRSAYGRFTQSMPRLCRSPVMQCR